MCSERRVVSRQCGVPASRNLVNTDVDQYVNTYGLGYKSGAPTLALAFLLHEAFENHGELLKLFRRQRQAMLR
jgi:hypothetical protein